MQKLHQKLQSTEKTEKLRTDKSFVPSMSGTLTTSVACISKHAQVNTILMHKCRNEPCSIA